MKEGRKKELLPGNQDEDTITILTREQISPFPFLSQRFEQLASRR